MNNRIHILAFMLALALSTVACSANLRAHETNIKTGASQTADIRVPGPEETSGSVQLNLEFIAGELNLSPGTLDSLVSGTADFNVPDYAPKTETSGTSYTLTTGDFEIADVAKFQDEFVNRWELQIADTPMTLNIQAGAYSGSFELGGLALEKLVISEGGSEATCTFSEPNKVEMSSFTYTTGGSTLVLKGLANANFEQMTFNCGAGDFTLSFDGDLQRDAAVAIDAKFSTMNLIVPLGVNAQVTFDGGLSSVIFSDEWAQNGDVYTLSGSGPVITITVKMRMGTLNLKTEY